ncbi:hypothetical protein ACOSQ2_029093 [Xanthoceras sorbifolium]
MRSVSKGSKYKGSNGASTETVGHGNDPLHEVHQNSPSVETDDVALLLEAELGSISSGVHAGLKSVSGPNVLLDSDSLVNLLVIEEQIPIL